MLLQSNTQIVIVCHNLSRKKIMSLVAFSYFCCIYRGILPLQSQPFLIYNLMDLFTLVIKGLVYSYRSSITRRSPVQSNNLFKVSAMLGSFIEKKQTFLNAEFLLKNTEQTLQFFIKLKDFEKPFDFSNFFPVPFLVSALIS